MNRARNIFDHFEPSDTLLDDGFDDNFMPRTNLKTVTFEYLNGELNLEESLDPFQNHQKRVASGKGPL